MTQRRGLMAAARVLSGALLAPGLVAPAAAAEFDCLIEPAQVVEVRSPVVGLLEQVHVRRGTGIRQG